MDNLIQEMNEESFKQIGKLVEAKLNKTPLNERCDRVNKILDALYSPITQKIEKVDRLVDFLRDTYDGLDMQTSNHLTFQIHDICRDVRKKFDNLNNTNGQHSPNILNISHSVDSNAVKPDVHSAKNDEHLENKNDMVSFAIEPQRLNDNRKLGKMVRVLVGLHCGSTAIIDSIEKNRMFTLKFDDGKTGKYRINQIEFME